MSRARRGYTLVEMMVTVAIMMGTIAIATPLMTRAMKQSRLGQLSRQMVGSLRQAQGLAALSQPITINGVPVNIQAAGVRFDTTTRYTIFVDADAVTTGRTADVQVVDFTSDTTSNTVAITSPAVGTTIRFKRDGSAGTTQTILLSDTLTATLRTVTLTAGGQARID